MSELNRRSFFWKAGCTALGLLGLEATWATVRFARAPVSYGPPTRRVLGGVERFPRNSAVYVEDAGVFVLHEAQGVRTLSATCTHLGCTVRQMAETGGYVCPCHGSRFDHEGRVVGGPAPEPLAFLDLRQDKRGRLVVDRAVRVEAARRLRIA